MRAYTHLLQFEPRNTKQRCESRERNHDEHEQFEHPERVLQPQTRLQRGAMQQQRKSDASNACNPSFRLRRCLCWVPGMQTV